MSDTTPNQPPSQSELDEASLDQVSGGCECKFPAQQIEPTRAPHGANSQPDLSKVKIDHCGNVIGYTE